MVDDAVLVTGGAGYIGAHCCKALATAGYRPIAFDNLVTGWRDHVRWGPLEEGDIRDGARLDAVFRKWKPRAVLHFAALSSVGASMADPLQYYRVNVQGSIELAEAAVRHGTERIIFSSSAGVYGSSGRAPIREDAPLSPLSPYGAGKAMVERMLADTGRAHGLRSVALRYFNAAGADTDCVIGERHEPETHLVPLILDAAIGIGNFTVNGLDYPTPDGSCVRDYVHVSDLADAHIQALELGLEEGEAAVFNLGTGQGHSVLDVLAAAERVTGRRIDVAIGPRRDGDPPELVCDSELALQRLGWRARRPAMDQIIADAWNWHVKMRG